MRTKAKCPECGRVFDLLDGADAAEWHYGHDCEPEATPWENNEVQFARLLCEIVATQDNLVFSSLCFSMDLKPEEVQELFDRAHRTWEQAKEKA